MRKKRNPLHLVVGLISLGVLGYFLLNFTPDKDFKVLDFTLPTIPIFITFLFVSINELLFYILNNQRQGILIGFFVTLYLVLRLNRLTHPFFLVLIVAILITLELLFKKRK